VVPPLARVAHKIDDLVCFAKSALILDNVLRVFHAQRYQSIGRPGELITPNPMIRVSELGHLDHFRNREIVLNLGGSLTRRLQFSSEEHKTKPACARFCPQSRRERFIELRRIRFQTGFARRGNAPNIRMRASSHRCQCSNSRIVGQAIGMRLIPPTATKASFSEDSSEPIACGPMPYAAKFASQTRHYEWGNYRWVAG